MPVPRLPPTPGASLDIEGKTAISHAPSISLGPAARDDGSERSYSATPSSGNVSESSYHPNSPLTQNPAKRKQPTSSRPSIKSGDDFGLPPPPSRARKIIQVKPAGNDDLADGAPLAEAAAPASKGGKKRGPNAGQNAAGRKIARKTAHSLIERRRRSKMNEEFGVLKDMIPACHGQEMHKLAILQASIEYLRYLERCVSDLKTAGHAASPPSQVVDHDTAMSEDEPEDSMPPPTQQSPSSTSSRQDSSYPLPPPQHANSHGSFRTLPSFSSIATSLASQPALTNTAFPPLDPVPRQRQPSIASSVAPSPYIPPINDATSPLFTAQHGPHRSSFASTGDAIQRFSLSSPALEPQDKRIRSGGNCSDREAMAALLMLNNDRRSSVTWTPADDANRGTRMSVKDLLG